jgi:peptidoglycan hydrolase-like protein with peptidoglycan-binding domain
MRRPLLILALLAMSAGAVAQSADHPYKGLISEVQEKLRELGFDPGPTNGDLGLETQAALAQFQLSRTIPAGGQLDDLTLEELNVTRPQESAAVGATATEDGEAGDTEKTGG